MNKKLLIAIITIALITSAMTGCSQRDTVVVTTWITNGSTAAVNDWSSTTVAELEAWQETYSPSYNKLYDGCNRYQALDLTAAMNGMGMTCAYLPGEVIIYPSERYCHQATPFAVALHLRVTEDDEIVCNGYSILMNAGDGIALSEETMASYWLEFWTLPSEKQMTITMANESPDGDSPYSVVFWVPDVVLKHLSEVIGNALSTPAAELTLNTIIKGLPEPHDIYEENESEDADPIESPFTDDGDHYDGVA